jgi:peptidoglycan/xylan/chitin deacetylase (PgdA/CDA1 family)
LVLLLSSERLKSADDLVRVAGTARAIPLPWWLAAISLERNPGVGQWIQRSGHDVCSHGWRWTEHWLLDREEEKARIGAAVESITRTTGAPPSGWYCRYSASVNTRELVAEYGDPFIYDSDAYNDDQPYFVESQRQEAARRSL